MTTWREFELMVERWVESLINSGLRGGRFTSQPQVQNNYSDGQTKRLDIRVSEARRGGRHLVIDAKHKPAAGVTPDDIRQVVDYRRRVRGSGAWIVHSHQTPVPETVRQLAEQNEVLLIPLNSNQNFMGRIARWRSGFFHWIGDD